MKAQRLAVSLSLLNVVLLIGIMASQVPSVAAPRTELPVLRGRALEIVDDQGNVRASIITHGPETVNGKEYPGAVVLRMGDPGRAPGVKLAASTKGAGLGLSSGERLADGKSAGIEMHADDPVVILRDKQGHERAVRTQEQSKGDVPATR